MERRKKRRAIITIAIPVIAFLIYLAWPLTDEKHAIDFNTERIKGRQAYLSSLEAAGVRAPNVIVILADDLGKSEVSIYGSSKVPTPHIDSIGNDGVVFTDAYATSPLCSPSRAALLTGRYQQRYGFETQPMTRYPKNRLEYYGFKFFVNTEPMVLEPLNTFPEKSDMDKQGLPPSEIVISESLTARNYTTAIMGKWHVGYSRDLLPNQRGFQYHYGFYEAFTLYSPIGTPGIMEHRNDVFSIKHQWRQERKGTSAIRVNGEIVEEKEYLTFRIAEETNRFITENSSKPFFLYVPFSAPHVPLQVPEEYYNRFSHVNDHAQQIYYGMIAAMDDAIGSILATLEKQGLAENTLIIFASDNGAAEYTGASTNGQLRAGKFTQFDGGLNVPFVMKWPKKIPRGQRVTEPISLMDIYTTAAAATETPLPSDRVIDGINLIPRVTGKVSFDPERPLFWRAMYNRAMRKGQWKLLVNDRTNTIQLFNLTSDRGETRDVSAEHPEIVQQLMNDLGEWGRGLEAPRWPHVMNYRQKDRFGEFLFAM